MTKTRDISEFLTQFGVSKKKSDLLVKRMDGSDLLAIANLDGTSKSTKIELKKILKKYGLNFTMRTPKLESIDQSNLILKESGFSHTFKVANAKDAEKFEKFLDDNDITYQNNSPLEFLINCKDRETKYKVDRYIEKHLSDTNLINELEEDTNQTLVQNLKNCGFKGKFGSKFEIKNTEIQAYGAEQDANKNWLVVGTDKNGKIHKIPVADANSGLSNISESNKGKPPKNKYAGPAAPRNPTVASMKLHKTGGGVHKEPSDDDKNPLSRKAKHKKKFFEEKKFVTGEEVMYNDNEYHVTVPDAPNNTIGLRIDGRTKMVNKSDVEKIEESVLGMTGINPLNRLKELAGIRTESNEETSSVLGDSNKSEFANEDYESDEWHDIDFGDWDAEVDDIEPDVEMNGFDDIGPELPDDMTDKPVVPSAIDLSPVPSLTNTVNANSSAMSQIQTHLNSIQGLLGEVKLSEFRSIIAKLDSLSVQVRSMGRDYLGESRRRK
jgi:hypothetical protein